MTIFGLMGFIARHPVNRGRGERGRRSLGRLAVAVVRFAAARAGGGVRRGARCGGAWLRPCAGFRRGARNARTLRAR